MELMKTIKDDTNYTRSNNSGPEKAKADDSGPARAKATASIKLPKLSIPKFDGDVLN